MRASCPPPLYDPEEEAVTEQIEVKKWEVKTKNNLEIYSDLSTPGDPPKYIICQQGDPPPTRRATDLSANYLY